MKCPSHVYPFSWDSAADRRTLSCQCQLSPLRLRFTKRRNSFSVWFWAEAHLCSWQALPLTTPSFSIKTLLGEAQFAHFTLWTSLGSLWLSILFPYNSIFLAFRVSITLSISILHHRNPKLCSDLFYSPSPSSVWIKKSQPSHRLTPPSSPLPLLSALKKMAAWEFSFCCSWIVFSLWLLLFFFSPLFLS